MRQSVAAEYCGVAAASRFAKGASHNNIRGFNQQHGEDGRREVGPLQASQEVEALLGLLVTEVMDVTEVTEDFNAFLAHIEKQKVEDLLLGASEISHSYNQKLLIMTDTEKSTSDRVQQEYSMDPHYSVKVTKDCLFNDSCVPAADGYTVVKIFGSVSEDGQTVSGLDGASLAKLMLKPSLEAAPVFSLDGNTTTQFHQNFIRVFMLRGLQTVLETNQNNQQIYQVMDRPDSVSSYKIPQRRADHSTQYDHQQIVMMENDPVVRRAAEYLYEKHPAVSSVYVLDENQRPKLIHGEPVSLSEDSRLVLVGHGERDNAGEMRLSGYSSGDVAKIIERTNRGSDKIKTTSVINQHQRKSVSTTQKK
ncbi:uncharacterized protein LOC118455792 [Neolamprologus brichardi]|uniref:uncharacterized protein LOC118455792 n=1 Tax=Neolamprologus brichardi TaxID=32507 RepID=UPI001643AD74|nr:uncharacterized protein LOC118455792 [Neolamprologus brichardi]